MFHKILVAMDSSEISKNAFNEALALAKATGANLMLLHVLSSEEEGYPEMPNFSSVVYYSEAGGRIMRVYQERLEAFEKQSLDLLQSHSNKATAVGITADFTQKSGSPGPTICEFARTWDADLIMMGRRGYSGLSELFLGSVSNYVLHHASCSILIVQSPKTSPQTQETNQAESVMPLFYK